MDTLRIDVWLYGSLAEFGREARQPSYANLAVSLAPGGTISDLLAAIHMPSEQRGITFINGSLSAMPGLQPDLDHALQDGDRVAFFDLRSMWPFQYRHGAAMIEEMKQALLEDRDQGLHHSYRDA